MEEKKCMLAYLSKSKGIGGKFKSSPDSFAVEEIMPDGRVLELDKRIEREDEESKGEFTHFVLQKRAWSTLDALRAIGRAVGCSIKRFSHAGLKDRQARTTQLASAWKIEPGRLLALSIKDIGINGAWKAGNKVKMGSLKGNRFTMHVEEVESEAGERVKSIVGELRSEVPNYFGEQRFGIRNNSQVVGEHLVRGEFEAAVKEYLIGAGGKEHADARKARRRLDEEGDYAEA
ncbi:tRNA pseudouridine(13) synthase TruD, partial [Candidatus Micrarchaeota archaeon]